ncbi:MULTISPECIES: YjcZ family sporulation protein [Bacillaceae]|nr:MULTISPECIES: YjcZ family sporulation protein [Bacillaceae]UOE92757.1 YjcZ family sporulation protein [Alkalihalobacillus sp. LMS39]
MSGVAGAGYGAGYGGFALLIVLFILLVIIGASWYGGYGAY